MSAASTGHLVPKELLDQVHVGHDHTPAAVAAATKLVHGITTRLLASGKSRPVKYIGSHSPIGNSIIKKLEVTLPKVSDNLHQDLAIAQNQNN